MNNTNLEPTTTSDSVSLEAMPSQLSELIGPTSLPPAQTQMVSRRDGGPVTSRRYMSKSQRACDFCRSRRSACRITDSLPCRLCGLYGRECTFNERSAPRKKRKSNGSSANVQSAPSDSQQVPESQNPVSPPLMFDINAAVESWSDNALAHEYPDAFQFMSNGDSIQDMPLDPDNMSDLVNGMLEAISGESGPVPLADGLVSHFVGPTGEQDPNMLRHYRFDEMNELWFKKLGTRSTFQGVSPVFWMLGKLDDPATKSEMKETEIASENRASLEKLVPPEVGDRLIKLFFKFIQPQFPVLSRASPPTPSDSPTCLLAAIYLITEQFSAHDDYLCIQVVYHRPSEYDLFDIAWKLFNDGRHEASIAFVQTAVILLLKSSLNPFDPDSSFRWSLLGLTVSMAQTLGLHLDAKHWHIPEPDILLRRRLSWVIYTLDTWIALYLGRPRHISTDNWMITDLDETDLGSTSTESEDSLFPLHFSTLSNMVATILAQLFTLKSSDVLTSDFRQTLGTGWPLLVELSTWYRRLPRSMQFCCQKGVMTEPDQTASLKLAYYAANFSVFRALLRALDNPEVESSLREEDTEDFKEARGKCRAAIKNCVTSFVDFMSILNSNHFEQFWPSWTPTFFAFIVSMGILLVVTAQDRQDARDCKALLVKARKVLRVQSRSFEMMRLALLRIDAHFWKGFDNVLRMHPNLGCTFEEID